MTVIIFTNIGLVSEFYQSLSEIMSAYTKLTCTIKQVKTQERKKTTIKKLYKKGVQKCNYN